MATITSSDGVASANVVIVQDTDGVYAIQVTSPAPSLVPFAVEFAGNRIWQGQARTDSGAAS